MKEYNQFTKLVGAVLAVPSATIKARVEEHRKEALKNPNKRGPKTSVSGRASRSKGAF